MKQGRFKIMVRLSALVKPLSGIMVLAILMGLIGHLCAAWITILGGCALLDALGMKTGVGMGTAFVGMGIFSAARAALRYGEQACNHFIAFKLLALIRDRVFGALRRLCPAKLEGWDKGRSDCNDYIGHRAAGGFLRAYDFARRHRVAVFGDHDRADRTDSSVAGLAVGGSICDGRHCDSAGYFLRIRREWYAI